jgi:hypothetical protein
MAPIPRETQADIADAGIVNAIAGKSNGRERNDSL